MKSLDETIKSLETDPVPMAYTARLSVHEDIITDALHYLESYRQLSSALISDNTVMTETGIYCKVCGTRLDKDWDDEDLG